MITSAVPAAFPAEIGPRIEEGMRIDLPPAAAPNAP